MTLTAEWIDKEREPVCPPQPQFPNGTDVDLSAGAAKTCSIEVPYPAKRCGLYIITCETCGQTNALTTAGRIDDPRKITFACFSNRLNPNPPGFTEIVLPDTAKMKRTPHHD